MGTVEATIKLKGLTNKDRIVELEIEEEFEDVGGRSWQEDMHPDGIGYYQSFFEPNEGELELAADEWIDKLSDEDIDFLFYDNNVLEEDEQVIKLLDWKVL